MSLMHLCNLAKFILYSKDTQYMSLLLKTLFLDKKKFCLALIHYMISDRLKFFNHKFFIHSYLFLNSSIFFLDIKPFRISVKCFSQTVSRKKFKI